MNHLIDLHLHSRSSDGSAGLLELLEKARRCSLTVIGLTDHDYTGHLDQAQRLVRKLLQDHACTKVKQEYPQLIGGVEISCKGAHILGYFLTSHSPAINSLCASTLRLRHQMTLSALEAFRANGVPVDLADVEAVAYGNHENSEDFSKLDRPPVLYRQHLLQAIRNILKMNESTFHLSFIELYHAVYGAGNFKMAEDQYPDPHDAVRAITEDGGCAVLAHPGLTKDWELVPSLVDAGLVGIEENHPHHNETDRCHVRELCKKYGLTVTGGSDWHGLFDEKVPSEHYTIDVQYLCPQISHVYFSDPIGRDLLLAEQTVLQAGAWLREQRRKIQEGSLFVICKNGDHRDLVSECDHYVESLIRQRFSCLFPTDLVIGEEFESPPPRENQRVWIVDPIDGTTNFIRQGRDYSISLALYQNRRPLFGLVYDVAAENLYRGIVGTGNYVNGNLIAPAKVMPVAPVLTEPLSVSDVIIDASLNTLLAFSRRGIAIEKWHAQLQGHRSLGCASLAIVRISLGELDAYFSERLHVWDWAAATVLLLNAGGQYTGLFGSQVDPYNTGSVPFAAIRFPYIIQALFECAVLSDT